MEAVALLIESVDIRDKPPKRVLRLMPRAWVTGYEQEIGRYSTLVLFADGVCKITLQAS